MKSKNILLLIGRDNPYWYKTLNKTVSILNGTLKLLKATDLESITFHNHDLIILDACIIQDLVSTISQIRIQDSKIRIVVFTSAPTWKQAREVILAGASDYSRKSLDMEYILSVIRRNLS